MTKSAATKYEVRHAGQLVDTRKSTSARIYTHAVVYQICEETSRRFAHSMSKSEVANARWSFQHDLDIVAGKAQSYQADGIAKAQARLDRAPTADDYVQEALADKILAFQAQQAKGIFGKWFLEGYCGRLDLARKLASKPKHDFSTYINHTVVEVIRLA